MDQYSLANKTKLRGLMHVCRSHLHECAEENKMTIGVQIHQNLQNNIDH